MTSIEALDARIAEIDNDSEIDCAGAGTERPCWRCLRKNDEIKRLAEELKQVKETCGD